MRRRRVGSAAVSRDTHLRLSLPARVQRGLLLAVARIPAGALAVLGRRAPVNSDGERVAPELAAIGWANDNVSGLNPFQGEVAQSRMQALGIESSPLSPAAFNAFVAKESARWRPLIKELGIRLDS